MVSTCLHGMSSKNKAKELSFNSCVSPYVSNITILHNNIRQYIEKNQAHLPNAMITRNLSDPKILQELDETPIIRIRHSMYKNNIKREHLIFKYCGTKTKLYNEKEFKEKINKFFEPIRTLLVNNNIEVLEKYKEHSKYALYNHNYYIFNETDAITYTFKVIIKPFDFPLEANVPTTENLTSANDNFIKDVSKK